MPRCKNDPSRSYTGAEPSPKGRGYCAHAEKVGARRKGGDGAMWVVASRSVGGKYWARPAKKGVEGPPVRAAGPGPRPLEPVRAPTQADFRKAWKVLKPMGWPGQRLEWALDRYLATWPPKKRAAFGELRARAFSELAELGVFAAVVPSRFCSSSGVFWGDWPPAAMAEIVAAAGGDPGRSPHIVLPLKVKDGVALTTIMASHYLPPRLAGPASAILKKHSARLEWDGSRARAMKITL